MGWTSQSTRTASCSRARPTCHLPGGSHTAVHDVTADEFFSICEERPASSCGASHAASSRVRYRRRLWWRHPGRGSPPSSRTLSCAHRSRRRSRAALIDHRATRRVSGSTVDGSPRYPLLLSLRLRAGAMGSARGRSQETSRQTWPAGPRGRSPNAAPPRQSAPALLGAGKTTSGRGRSHTRRPCGRCGRARPRRTALETHTVEGANKSW